MPLRPARPSITYPTNASVAAHASQGGAAADDGCFVVVWTSEGGQDGHGSGVFGQLLCVDDNENAICDSQESARACGDAADSEGITTTDVLFVLRAIVGATPALRRHWTERRAPVPAVCMMACGTRAQ